MVECWSHNPVIPGSNPNFLAKFQLKKFRFHIWNAVFRIRSINHKNIRMRTHGVEEYFHKLQFQSYKLLLPPHNPFCSLWIYVYLKPNLVFLRSNQHWLSECLPQEDMNIIRSQMLINHLIQNWEPNNYLNYVGSGVYSVYVVTYSGTPI